MRNFIIKTVLMAGILIIYFPSWAKEPQQQATTSSQSAATAPALPAAATPQQRCEALAASNDQSELAKLSRAVGCAELLGTSTTTTTQPAE